MKNIFSRVVSSLVVFSMVASSFGALMVPSFALAADTGFISPTAEGENHNGWTNGANAFSSNNSYATSTTEDSDQSFEDFGFSIPNDSTINGIEVSIEAKSSDTSGCQAEVRMWSTSDNEHTNYDTQSLTGSDAVYVLGASSDLWGSTWIASDFSDANFHLEIRFDDASGISCNSSTVSLDQIQAKVYYTAALPPDYSISGSAVLNNTIVDLSGLSGANPQKGADGTQHMAVDWDEDQDNDPSTGTGWEVAPAGGLSFTPTFSGSNPNRSFTDNWSGSHDYGPSAGGTYNISVMIYHGNTPGQDGDAQAILNLEIVILPQCSDGIDNDGDTLVDFIGNDPGCTSADDDTESPNPSTTGTLTLVKILPNNDGGTALADNFTVNIDGDASTWGSHELEAGEYTITEDAVSGYEQDFSACGTDGVVTISVEEETICTITNDDMPASLTLIKKVDGGDATSNDWTLYADDTSFNSGDTKEVDAGTYDLSESTGPEDYVSLGWECTGDGTQEGATITLGLGDSATCTVTNEYNPPTPGTITIVKNTVGGDATFSFTGTLGDFDITTSGGTGNKVFNSVTPGTYSVSELAIEGWNDTSAECSDRSELDAIELGEEESITCTFVNTKTTGTLKVVKNLINDDEGQNSKDDFYFQVNGGEQTPFDVNGEKEITVPVGTYTVTEVEASGYTASYQNCSEVEVGPGDIETCTITNDDNEPNTATVTAMKIVCPSETMLPNWGNGEGENEITPTVITNFLEENEECYTSDWDFEWAQDGVEGSNNPGNNATGDTGGAWTKFSDGGSITLPAGVRIWFREQVNPDYIPFSGDTSGEDGWNDVSAEFYCGTDVLNYDNFDFIDTQMGASYSCVGFNVLEEQVFGCTDPEATNYNEEAKVNDGSCEYPEVYACSDNINNDDNDDLIDSLDPECHTDGDADNEESYDPTDDNEDEEESRSSSSGSRRPSGQVLGAETAICNWDVNTYMRRGYKNNKEQVTILQRDLLNGFMGSNLAVDGVYGPKTEAAVKAFQLAKKDKILIPWNLTLPTGIFYKTTLVEAKNTICPVTILPIPTDLIPWSANPEVAFNR